VRSILVVAGDPTTRTLVARQLPKAGFMCVGARTADEAREFVASGPVDLAIVDADLPDGRSTALVGELRTPPHAVPVVYLVGHRPRAAELRTLYDELGVELVAFKPLAGGELRIRLHELLALDPSGTPAPVAFEAEPETSLVDRLVALRRSYEHRLQGRLGDLIVWIEAPEAGGWAAVSAELHKIKGTAGSYGLPEVGERVSRAETLLAPAADGRGTLDEALRSAAVREIRDALALLEAAMNAVAAEGDPTRPGPPAPTSNLLVVDPDEEFREQIERLGRDVLVRVVAVANAVEAMRRAQAERFDAVMIDVRLPGGDDCLELAADLRRLDGYAEVPLAFITESPTVADRLTAAHAGASLFLTKPLGANRLAEAARDLGRARAEARPRVLIIDDDPDFIDHVQALLQSEQVNVSSVTDPTAVFRALEAARPDVVLVDAMMPRLSGFDVCRMLRAAPEWADLPLILVTSRVGPDVRVAAFAAGADDYLAKPVVREELLARIRVRVERAAWVRERTERDALTGLLLRRPFTHALQARLAEARRYDRPLALAMLDLDHFKEVNDQRGHLVGDNVLMSLGALLAARFRAEDLRGRWGGEEFILAFPGQTLETAHRLIERVRDELRAIEFKDDEGAPFHVSLSAGVSASPSDGSDLVALIRIADHRLLMAKRVDRGRVVSE